MITRKFLLLIAFVVFVASTAFAEINHVSMRVEGMT